MLDAHLRPLIDRPLNMAGRWLAKAGIGADEITLAGFVAGMTGAAAILLGQFTAALVLILAGRVLDGLDGAVARATRLSDRGGFLDITLDFIFYGAVPLAFAAYDPWRNALPAACLIASFYANGAAFLAYGIMQAKRGVTATTQGVKSLHYMVGLTEGAETIALFVLICLFPDAFPILAFLFAALCFLSAAARILIGWRTLG